MLCNILLGIPYPRRRRRRRHRFPGTTSFWGARRPGNGIVPIYMTFFKVSNDLQYYLCVFIVLIPPKGYKKNMKLNFYI